LTLAVSFARAVIAGAGGYLAGRTGAPTGGTLAMAPIGDPALVRLLDTVLSGQAARAGDATMKHVSSFRDEAGTLCREFELASTSTVIPVVCRVEGHWDARLAVAAPSVGTDYVPAGAAEAVDADVDPCRSAALGSGRGRSAQRVAAETGDLRENRIVRRPHCGSTGLCFRADPLTQAQTRKGSWMARAPNYNQERKERDRIKAAKKAEKLAAKSAKSRPKAEGESEGKPEADK
jgi:hypothetical protein